METGQLCSAEALLHSKAQLHPKSSAKSSLSAACQEMITFPLWLY
jgi:hypothetical protein